MKSLNANATAVFMKLIDGLDGSRKIANDATFMTVYVEVVGQSEMGRIISIAHYYEQNGDLMADPDMTFLVTADQRVFPLTFQQASFGLYQEAAWFDGGRLLHRPKLQADLVSFANSWMQNIAEQQNL